MSESKQIDWTKAPEGITDYNSENDMWYKKEEGVMHYWSNHRSLWREGGKRSEYGACFIQRPVETKKVRYEKVEDLPNGWFVR